MKTGEDAVSVLLDTLKTEASVVWEADERENAAE